jgi:hypothetical protein
MIATSWSGSTSIWCQSFRKDLSTGRCRKMITPVLNERPQRDSAVWPQRNVLCVFGCDVSNSASTYARRAAAVCRVERSARRVQAVRVLRRPARAAAMGGSRL